MHAFGRGVGKQDVVDVDVAPATLGPVDDLDFRLMSQQVADVPKIPFELFVVLAGRRADDLAAREQIDARLVGPISAADAELNVRTSDRELRRRQRALRIVAVQVTY